MARWSRRSQRPVLSAVLLLVALAGCAAGPEDPKEAAVGLPATARSPPAVAVTSVHVDGSTALGACAASQCRYEMTDTAFGRLPETGTGLRLNGTLTWTAVSPTSLRLTVYVPSLVDGEYEWSPEDPAWSPEDPAASGTSPLHFDLDLSAYNSTTLGLIVGNGVATGSPAGVFAVQTPQPFVLDAAYTSRS